KYHITESLLVFKFEEYKELLRTTAENNQHTDYAELRRR
ncbi:hypothetical protein CDAR_467131, partial [Caerostris darwini]